MRFIPRKPALLSVFLSCLAILTACSQDSGPIASAEAQAPATEQATKAGASSAMETIENFIAEAEINKEIPGWKGNLPRPPQAEFTGDESYFWKLETNKGDITIKLMPDVAPMHVSSTVYLTKLGFYDNTIFHRIIQGFMAQGGDPLGNGTGGPGYQYGSEFSSSVRHDRGGLLSMANAGQGTDGSQFFLTFVPTPWLDDAHTIFGEIVEGMETMDILEAAGSRSGTTSEKLEIVRATIIIE